MSTGWVAGWKRGGGQCLCSSERVLLQNQTQSTVPAGMAANQSREARDVTDTGSEMRLSPFRSIQL